MKPCLRDVSSSLAQEVCIAGKAPRMKSYQGVSFKITDFCFSLSFAVVLSTFMA